MPERYSIEKPQPLVPFFRGGSKPYTRWWWLAGPFRREDIRYQLSWLKSNGFGGVELAWLWPTWMGNAEPGIEWLGPEWSDLVAFTKQEADRLGLGCDFTFGSCWPFGGSAVRPEDAARTFDGLSRQRLHGSWEDRDGGHSYVLNHLDRGALRRYAEALMPAFAGGLRGSTLGPLLRLAGARYAAALGPQALGPLRRAVRLPAGGPGGSDRRRPRPPLRLPNADRRGDPARVLPGVRGDLPRAWGRFEGPVPRGADRPALGLRRGGHPRVGGDPVRRRPSRGSRPRPPRCRGSRSSAPRRSLASTASSPGRTSSPTVTGTRSRWPT